MAFPWLAYDVVNDGSGANNTGVYRFTNPHEKPGIILKDLRGTAGMPSSEDLKQSQYSMNLLDEDVFASCKTFTSGRKPTSAPAFLIQANLISHGLILTFVAQHNTMDMTGQAHVIFLFSKACCGEPFTVEELSSGNAVRHNIIPLLDDSWAPGPELEPFIRKDEEKERPPITTEVTRPVICTWAYLNFSGPSLERLKSKAHESVKLPEYISTDDAITAFIWQAVTRARAPRLNPSLQSIIAHAVNVRKGIGILPTYPRPYQISAYTILAVR
jgi:hypothetical protein